MIQEYIFNDKKHRKEIEQYEYKAVEKEIYDIDETDCWIVMFSFPGQNENTAIILSEVNNYMKKFNPIILSNECSAFFNKKLYPLFNEFERKLRKLLYLKSALSDDDGVNVIKNLEQKDLGEVFELLFADRHFTENVRKEVNNRSWVFTKKEILNCLEEIQEDTLWERLFSKDSESDLHNNFYQVKKYRNDIMHAHEMDTKSFRFAQKLIENINKELDKEIGKLLDKNNIPQNNISEHNFNKMISDVAKEAENAKQIARDSILDLVTKIIKNGINDEYSNNVAPEQQE